MGHWESLLQGTSPALVLVRPPGPTSRTTSGSLGVTPCILPCRPAYFSLPTAPTTIFGCSTLPQMSGHGWEVPAQCHRPPLCPPESTVPWGFLPRGMFPVSGRVLRPGPIRRATYGSSEAGFLRTTFGYTGLRLRPQSQSSALLPELTRQPRTCPSRTQPPMPRFTTPPMVHNQRRDQRHTPARSACHRPRHCRQSQLPTGF